MVEKKMKKRLVPRIILILIIGALTMTMNGPFFSGENVYAATSDTYKKAKPITYSNTGNPAKDIVGVAKTQKGQGEYRRYWSSDLKRDIVRTAYGDYFNYDYEWCAAFICWCARKADIPKSIIPTAFTASPKYFNGKYYSRGTVVPKAGDIIFYGNSSHVGIVEKSENGYVYTIEGNTSIDSGGNGYVDTHKYKLTNTYIMGYKRPNYAEMCSHSSFSSTTGKCTKCGVAYINADKSKLTTSACTSYSAKRFYKISAETPVYKYTSTGANKYATFPAGRHVQVLGTLSSGSWYKVKYKTTTGYVPSSKITKYTPSSASSKISIGSTKDEYTAQHRVKTTFSATASSNYPLRKLKVTITNSTYGTKIYSKTYEALYLRSTTLQGATGFDTSKLKVGTYDYTFTATDISGKSDEKKGKIVIYDNDVKVPTVKESLVSNGKNVVIETTLSNAVLYYSRNGGEPKKVSGSQATFALVEGKNTIRAFVYVGSKRSANVKKTFTLSKADEPEIAVEQQGKTGLVTIKSKGTARYSVDGGATYQDYVKPFEVGGNTTIKAYTQQRGYLRSSVVAYTTDYTEPGKPVVKIAGTDSNIAAGKTVTLNWGADRSAETYKAVLYDASNDSEVEAITTDKTTVTFTIPKAGEYYVTVIASNEIGSSDESDAVSITGKDPITVKFIDQKASEEDDDVVLSEQKVTYGECCEAIASSPSRKGHSFVGWKDTETDTVSTNGYLKKTITKEATFEAQYEAVKYKVKLYDTTGELLQTQIVEYGKAVSTEGLTEKVTIDEGYEFAGWQITRTSEGDSNQDMNKVDSDMEIHAVSVWGNPELPVIANVTSAKVSADGKYVNAEVRLTTEKEKDLSFYLIVALKAKDANNPELEKTMYVDRKITYLDAGTAADPSETTVKVKMPMTSETKASGSQTFEPSSVEAAVVECKEDMSTGSALSETAECEVVRDSGVPYYGDYQISEVKPEEKEGREIVEVPTYVYRDKERVKNGYNTLAGYTKESTATISTTYGNWQSSVPSESATEGATYKTTVTKETRAAHRWYSYYCDCKKTCWKSKTGTCGYCGGKTDNTVIAYTTTSYSPNASADNDGSYKFAKTIESGDANRYCIYYNGSYVKSFSSLSTKVNVTYFWKSSTFENHVYRTKTVKTQNTFWKWGEWKTSAEPVTATSDRQLGETTYSYKYRDLISPEEAVGRTNELDPDGTLAKHCSGALTSISEDLSGKVATIMVYQANNTDPNKYQMQYVGHTEIGSGNSYDFSFICSEQPSVESGNYIVTLSIPGSTGLITIDKIEAPKAKHTVKFYYTDSDGTEKQLGDVQEVENGSDAVIPKILDAKLSEEQENEGYVSIAREGYYFVGWSDRTTNVTENMDIKAIYVPLKNSIVFVDWLNQSIEQKMALTETTLTAPEVNSEAEGHTFKGWKLPDGTTVGAGEDITVTGNMIIEAVYDTDEYEVWFHDADGNVLDKQKVKYGESAEPPEYTGDLKGGEFVSWSTKTNWWRVTSDIDVRPVLSFEETAQTPVIRTIELETEESEEVTRGIEIESEDEGARIFYTTDGTDPTSEMVQEFALRGECTENVSMAEYTEPVTFEEDTVVTAVAYIEGKNVSEAAVTYFELEYETNETNSSAVSDEWEELKTVNVKAAAGKDIEVSVSLDENPGLLGCGILVCADNETFYTDSDEYGDPVVTAGEVLDTGRTVSTESMEGWDTTWYGESQSVKSGKLLSMTLHFNDDAEEGMYPISVFYAPEKTYNDEYDDVSLANAKVEVNSQASIDIAGLEATLSRTTYSYDGSACEPVVIIEGLSEGVDFEVSYENNVNAGTAKAVITGKDTYVGKTEKEFTITQANIGNADIEAIADQVNTGSAIEPELEITYDGAVLEKDRDYTVSYEGNTDIGTATVTIRGTGNFKGVTSVQFNIVKELTVEGLQKQLEEAQNQIDSLKTEKADAEQALAAAETAKEKAEADAQTAKSNLEKAETELAKAQAAKEEAESNAQASEEAKAQAEANYNAAVAAKEAAENDLKQANTEKSEAVSKAEAAQAEAQAAKESAAKAESKIAQLEKQIEELIANGGSITSLAEITVSGIASKSYTGSPVTQKITLKVDDEVLEEGTDYEIEYSNNINVGVATMTIRGIGKFRGTIKRTFKINPKATKLSKLTRKSRGFTAYWYRQTAQTTGYQLQYSLSKTFKSPKTLTIKGSSASYKSVTKLKKRKYYYVRVRTYKTVGSTNYYSSWSSYKYVKTK